MRRYPRALRCRRSAPWAVPAVPRRVHTAAVRRPLWGVSAAALALTVALLAGPATDGAFADPRGGLIVEGRSIAGLALGDTKERMLALWGRPHKADHRPGCDEQTSNTGVAALCRYSNGRVWLDWTGHVIGMDVFGGPFERVRVRPSRRRGTFATRAGVGPGLLWRRAITLYRGRLVRTRTISDLGEWMLRGSGDAITLVSVGTVTATRIVGSVGVFRRLRPALALATQTVGPGLALVVRATGLLPGSRYQLQVSYDDYRRAARLRPGEADYQVAAVEHAIAGVDGTLTLTVPYEGALQGLLDRQWWYTEGDAIPPPPRPSAAAGLVVLQPYLFAPSVQEDGSVDLSTQLASKNTERDLWLGPITVSTPATLAVPPLDATP